MGWFVWLKECGAGEASPEEVVPGVGFFSATALSWERDGVMATASGFSESWDAPWSSGPRSSPHARAARALEVRAHPCCAHLPPPAFSSPGSSPSVLSCFPTPRFPVRSCPPSHYWKKGPSGGPDSGGLLCGPTSLGRLLLEGQQQDKSLLDLWGASRIVLVWDPAYRGGVVGGALHRFGNSRVIDKTVTVT